MAGPAPRALLVEHPALPVPTVIDDAIQAEDSGGDHRPRLSRRQRLRLAAQLTALTCLLAEFDLWPGRWSLAGAGVTEDGGELQAVLAGFPRSLTEMYRRLGGGEQAADRMRRAAAEAITHATGVPVPRLGTRHAEPGFVLEPHLDHLLDGLSRPMDAGTARNLWAERWELPPLPEEGEVVYWRAPSVRVSRRLTAALWSALRRQHVRAWLRVLPDDEEEAVPPPAASSSGVLLLAGSFSDEDLAAAGRWAERPGSAAAVVGLFPPGWRPPPAAGLDPARLSLHLALTGGQVQRCREHVERRRGRFDPAGEADRAALTAAARWRWRPPAPDAIPRPPAMVERCLRLVPEGVPEGFLEVQAGRSGSDLRSLCPAGSVVVEARRWRLPQPELLEPDPLHAQVVGLYEESDPRRLRHRALADGDAGALAAHCRLELDELRGAGVRELLAPLAPNALGDEVRLLLAESCLAELDLVGARSALEGVQGPEAGPYRAWLGILDARAGFAPVLPEPAAVAPAPRAAAEVALFALRRAVRTGEGDAAAARRVLTAAMEAVTGALARWFALEVAAVEAPHLLSDRSWRRRMITGHPVLERRWLHLRGLRLADGGRPRAGRRMLERALVAVRSPGWQGLLQLDLGYLLLEEGRSRLAAAHLLRAFRLLEAAGFLRRTQAVLFNLAVCDLDALEVARAGSRMDELDRRAEGGADPFVSGERARLALAVGDEAAFRHLLARFPVTMVTVDDRFEEQLSLLRGVEGLLGGDRRLARGLLERGGAEGRPWIRLLDALEGRPPSGADVGDQWGVGLAAALVRWAARPGAGAPPSAAGSDREPTLAEGLALALTERLLGRQPWIGQDLRRRAVGVLEGGGLRGWARQLSGWSGATEVVLGRLADLAEGGGPDGLDQGVIGDLLGAFALTGIEVRPRQGGAALWRWGEGTPAAAVVQGRLLVTPLGGEPSSGSGWRLLVSLLELLLPELPPGEGGEEEETGLWGGSEAMRRLRAELRQAAPTGIEVLLRGETGVGKEVAARALHRLSGRRGQFVPVNMAAVPAALLESELFGSVRGAYTGADRSRGGLADAAVGGTLFLDEIGDLDPSLQVKLLRFLESGEVRAVGSDHFHQVDARIVAATHQDLPQRVAEGSFRRDLYYRIGALPIEVPPLRQRLEDIPVLRARFQAEAVAGKGLASCRWSGEAEAALQRYRWPGNVRELRHVVEVAMVRAAGATVRSSHLNLDRGSEEVGAGRWDEALTEFRRRFLSEALRRNGGNRSATARELGISRQALLYQIRQLGLGDESRLRQR